MTQRMKKTPKMKTTLRIKMIFSLGGLQASQGFTIKRWYMSLCSFFHLKMFLTHFPFPLKKYMTQINQENPKQAIRYSVKCSLVTMLMILFLLSICTVKETKHRLVLDHLVHHLPLGHGLPGLDVLPVPDPDAGYTVCKAPLTQDLPGPVFFTK